MTQQAQSTDVRVTVTVQAPVERAFEVFTSRFDSWWPHGHHLGDADLVEAVIEPGVGGRWYERCTDGSECDWGTVLAWEPPGHVALSWRIGPDWEVDPEPQRASRIDVHFSAESPGSTSVTLVHSRIDRHGPGWESLRDAVGGPGGWPGILESLVEGVRAG